MITVKVKKSKIHGLGVFATRDFKKGEIVLKWNPRELTKAQVEKLPRAEKRYIMFSKGKYWLMRPPERFVNHSCDANTYVRNFCDVAKRNIKTGEEITSNYSGFLSPGEQMKCKCKSKNCAKIIT